MILRWLISAFISVLLIALQSTWLNYISFMSVIPDLSLLFIIYLAFHSRSIKGQSVGFVAGLIEDSISASPLGLNAFLKTSIAFFANLLSGKFYIDKILMPAVFAILATILKAVLTIILALFFKGKIQAYSFFSLILWIECAYNALAAPVLFLLLSPLNRFMFGVGLKNE